MVYNYHTHTKRCGHAGGEDREYVESAINSGIRVLGFADHAPLVYEPDLPPAGDYRMPISLAEDYCRSILDLKEEYKNDIEIHLGVEIEYFPEYFDRTYKYLKELGIEYMILGQHYAGTIGKPGGRYVANPTTSEAVLEKYVDTVVEQMATKRYICVAHPDIINYQGNPELLESSFRKICEASITYDTPLEINLLGIRDGRAYPRREFWKIAGELGVKTMIGIDAHHPSRIAEAERDFAKWESFLTNCGINVSRETFADFENTVKRELL